MINANFQENTWSKKTPLWDNGVHKENVKELLNGLINVFLKIYINHRVYLSTSRYLIDSAHLKYVQSATNENQKRLK